MKILFVYPNIVESPKDISTGLAMIAAVCKKKGHEVSLIDSSFGIKDSEIIKKAQKFNPNLIAITVATNDFEYATHVSRILKKIVKVPIIVGGFHSTTNPEEIIRRECFDMVCIGEGEGAILDVANAIEKNKSLYKIKNLWLKKIIKGKVKIIKNPVRKLVENLDSLPFPYRELFDYKQYLQWNHGTATFISTRGCPFNCTYCINNKLMKLYEGKGCYVRFRSIDHLFKEIKEVLSRYSSFIKNIEFYDDTFTLNSKRVEEFCRRYNSEIGLPFNLNARVNAVNPEMFKLLKKAGCVRVSMAIECGEESIRNKILKRNMSDKQIISTFQAAKKAGLKTCSFNIVGLPFETKESIKKTIELNKKCRPDYVGVTIFNALPGVEIYDLCKKNNWVKEGYAKSFFRESNMNHPNFTINELRNIRNSLGFKIFLGYNIPRAFVDLIDRNLSQIDSYIFIRSKIIEKLNLLRK